MVKRHLTVTGSPIHLKGKSLGSLLLSRTDGCVPGVLRDYLRREATGGNLSLPHNFEAKLKASNEIAKFLLRRGTNTGSSEGSEASEEPLALVAQAAIDINPER